MSSLDCPLCAESAIAYAEDCRRAYYRCRQCDLVFADPSSHLNRTAERAVYDQHENDPDDPRYRRFLGQLFEPLVCRLDAGMRGLDFGCGPGPALAVMLQEAGMRMEVYDPFFAPDASVLKRQYDFVTCTEVAEHFCRPSRDWARLVSLVRAGGWLGVMTRLRNPSDQFDEWYYKNDPTHVSFYSSITAAWLASHYRLAIEHQSQNIVLYRKSAKS